MNLSDRIQDLNYNLLKLSSLVETNIKEAFSAIEEKDLDKLIETYDGVILNI